MFTAPDGVGRESEGRRRRQRSWRRRNDEEEGQAEEENCLFITTILVAKRPSYTCHRGGCRKGAS